MIKLYTKSIQLPHPIQLHFNCQKHVEDTGGINEFYCLLRETLTKLLEKDKIDFVDLLEDYSLYENSNFGDNPTVQLDDFANLANYDSEIEPATIVRLRELAKHYHFTYDEYEATSEEFVIDTSYRFGDSDVYQVTGLSTLTLKARDIEFKGREKLFIETLFDIMKDNLSNEYSRWAEVAYGLEIYFRDDDNYLEPDLVNTFAEIINQIDKTIKYSMHGEEWR